LTPEDPRAKRPLRRQQRLQKTRILEEAKRGVRRMKCKVCSEERKGRKLICYECWNKPFDITSVCRADLQDICTEEEIAKLDDGHMAHIAGKMADAYCDQGFWIDLEIIARDVLERE
jgi:hypothetical protein